MRVSEVGRRSARQVGPAEKTSHPGTGPRVHPGALGLLQARRMGHPAIRDPHVVLDVQRLAGNNAVGLLLNKHQARPFAHTLGLQRREDDSDAVARPTIDLGLSKEEFEKGTVAYDAEDFETARTHLLSSYLAAPRDARPTLAFNLGQACRRSGRHEEAISYYQEYLATGDPSFRESAMQGMRECRSKAADATGENIARPDGEEENLDFAKEEFEKGTVAYDAEDFETARTQFLSSYLAADRDARPTLAFNLGQVCRRSGRHEEAIGYYQEYLGSGDGEHKANTVEGLRMCRAALGVDSEEIAVPEGGSDVDLAKEEHAKGSTAYVARDYETARAHFLRSYVASPEEKRAVLAFNTGQACRRAGRHSEAIGFYKEYLTTGDGAVDSSALDAIRASREKLAEEAGDHVEKPPAVTPGQPEVERSTVREGSSGDDVVHLQRRLNTLGVGTSVVGPVDVDGAFNATTFARVVLAQEVLGVTVDGVVGPQSWAAIEAATNASTPAATGPAAPVPPGFRPTLKRGSRGTWVGRLQAGLNASGSIPAPPLKVDTIFGPRTRSRTILFQEARRLDTDGVAGKVTWSHVEQMIAPERSPAVAAGAD